MKLSFCKGLLGSVLLGGSLLGSGAGNAIPPGAHDVEATLDRFHQAASNADGAAYFALFAPEAVFIGTDANERWTVDQFKAYAMPYFSRGKGWTYISKLRHVQFSPQGDVAWFDEILDNKAFGVCRGSGVLRKVGDSWLICQYHLTIPVPNDLAAKVVKIIREAGGPVSPR
jgi:ketosteroid isomerase-like protein